MTTTWKCYRAMILAGLGSAILAGQPVMPSSPARGINATLTVAYDGTSTGNVTLIMAPTMSMQGSCYVELHDDWQGFRVWLYNTSSGQAENPVSGAPGWAQTLTSNACSINLANSVANTGGYPYRGATLALSALGALSGTLYVRSNYLQRTCDEYCNWEYGTATIGRWETSMSGGYGPVLVSPVHGSVLTARAQTFTWGSIAGATTYCLSVGSRYGWSDYGSPCGPVTSATIGNLPNTGGTLYLRTVAYVGGEERSSDYTVQALEEGQAAEFVSPAAGSTVSGTSFQVTWDTGTNVSKYQLAISYQAANGDWIRGTAIPVGGLTQSIPLRSGSRKIELTLYSQFPSGWSEKTRSFHVAGGGATGQDVVPVPSSPYCDPPYGSGTPLTGNLVTISWNAPVFSGNAGTSPKYYLEVGTGTQGGDVYPSMPADRGIPFTATSRTIDVGPWRGAGDLWVNLWWSATDPVTGKNAGLRKSAHCIIHTSGGGGLVTPPEPDAAYLLAPEYPGSVGHRNVGFAWTGGVGVDAYWLRVGTASGLGNLYNSYNDATPFGLQIQRATVDAIPSGVTQIYVTLSSRRAGLWISRPERVYGVSSDGNSGQIPESFYACVQSGTPGATCTLPVAGIFAMGGSGAAPIAGIPFLNRPIYVGRSGVTVAGPDPAVFPVSGAADNSVVFLRMQRCEAGPGGQILQGNEPIMHIGKTARDIPIRVADVTVKNFNFDGNNESLADTCNVDQLVTGTLPAFQPNVWDLAIEGVPPSVSGNPSTIINLRNVRLSDALGRGLAILGPMLNTVRVEFLTIEDAAVTGALVWGDRGAETHTSCDGMAYLPASVPWYVTFAWSHFTNNWTGALFNTGGAGFYVEDNYFSGNYWNPYDDAGGTMGMSECTVDTKIRRNSLLGWGMTTITDGLEIHARDVMIEGNYIIGYPDEGIGMASTADVTIRDNHIYDNGQRASYLDPNTGALQVSATSAGVVIFNYSGRQSKNIAIYRNEFLPPSGSDIRQRTGIRYGQCPGGAVCIGNVLIDMFEGLNTFSPGKRWCQEAAPAPGVTFSGDGSSGVVNVSRVGSNGGATPDPCAQ